MSDLDDIKYLAQQIRTEFRRAKQRLTGKSYRDPRNDKEAAWIKAAKLCKKLGASPEDFVAVAFDRVGVSPTGPLPSHLGGKVMRERFTEFQRSTEITTTKIVVEKTVDENGNEITSERYVTYNEFQRSVTVWISTTYSAITSASQSFKMNMREVLEDSTITLDPIARCLIGWGYPAVREQFGYKAKQFFKDNPGYVNACLSMNINVVNDILTWEGGDPNV